MRNPYKLNLSRYSTHQILVDNIGKGKIILDVGCNEGYLGKVAEKSNIFYGLDYSKKAIGKTKKIYKDASIYDLNQLKKIPWNIKFDVIMFADVLEHLNNPEKVLGFFVTKYLKKRGIVIISLPNVANWQVRLNLFFGKFEYTDIGIMDKTHLHFYTFNSTKKLLKKSGLNLVRMLSGASFFGPFLKILPFAKQLLATNIILICKK